MTDEARTTDGAGTSAEAPGHDATGTGDLAGADDDGSARSTRRVLDLGLVAAVLVVLAAWVDASAVALPAPLALLVWIVTWAGGALLALWTLALAVLWGLALLRRRPDTARLIAPRVMVLVVVAAFSVAVVRGGLPRRVMFEFSRSSFASLLTSSELVETSDALFGDDARFEARVGCFAVDRAARDPRGGSWFRVGSGSWLETYSWGFVHEPNPQGTPFGNAGYSLQELGDGWWWFTANDDH